MTDQELKRLKRVDLLELLINLGRENEQLRKRLEDRQIRLSESGSIAEAALRLNNIFEDAENAAAQYVESIHALQARQKSICDKMLEDTRAECEKMLEETKAKCEEMLADAQQGKKVPKVKEPKKTAESKS